MRTTRIVLLPLLLFLGLGASTALADTVRLRDGQRLQGEVVQRTSKQVVLKTRYGVLVIPARDVRRVDADRAVIVARPMTRSALNKLRLLHLRAKRLRLLKRYAKAVERYGELVALQPADAEALYWQAVCRAQLGQKAEALKGLERAALAGFSDFESLRRSPLSAGLRGHPEFSKLLERRRDLLAKAAAKAPQRLVSWLKLRGALAEYRVDPAPDLGLTFVYADSAAFALARKEFTGWVKSLRRDLFRATPGASIYVVLLAAEDKQVLLTVDAASFDPVRNTLVCSPLPGGILGRSRPTLRALVQALHAEDQAARGQRHPLWLGQGLVELFGSARLERGRATPVASGRLAAFQKQAKRPLAWKDLLAWDAEDLARRPAARDQARTLLHSLHSDKKLAKFYEAYGRSAEGGSGVSAVEVALGGKLASAEAARRRWLAEQTTPRLPFTGMLTRDARGGLRVTYVQAESGASRANLGEGDIVIAVDGARVRRRGDLDELLGTRAVGETILVDVRRGQRVLRAKLVLTPRPKGPIGPNRGAAPYLGLSVTAAVGRVAVREVQAGSPAALAGIARGDLIQSLDGARITSVRQWLRALRLKKPGQKGAVVVERSGKALSAQVTFTAFGAKAKPSPPARPARPSRRF